MTERSGWKLPAITIDIKIVFAVGICVLMAAVIPEFQIMTACIAALLCVQNGMKESLKAGLLRLLITFIGGITGIMVILADIAADKPRLFPLMIMAGVFLTLLLCKLVRVPVFNARIGGVTFILVVLTKEGTERIYYALFRLCSTLYGAAAVMLVSAFFVLFTAVSSKLRKGRL